MNCHEATEQSLTKKAELHYLFLYSVGVTPNFYLKHLLK